jgi:hypothetical protein
MNIESMTDTPLPLRGISPKRGDNPGLIRGLALPWRECPKSLPRFYGGKGGFRAWKSGFLLLFLEVILIWLKKEKSGIGWFLHYYL